MGGWIALFQFMEAKKRELKERKEERERLFRRHRVGHQSLRRIRLSRAERQKLQAKIVEQQERRLTEQRKT
jgi:hypothetical protein